MMADLRCGECGFSVVCAMCDGAIQEGDLYYEITHWNTSGMACGQHYECASCVAQYDRLREQWKREAAAN